MKLATCIRMSKENTVKQLTSEQIILNYSLHWQTITDLTQARCVLTWILTSGRFHPEKSSPKSLSNNVFDRGWWSMKLHQIPPGAELQYLLLGASHNALNTQSFFYILVMFALLTNCVPLDGLFLWRRDVMGLVSHLWKWLFCLGAMCTRLRKDAIYLGYFLRVYMFQSAEKPCCNTSLQ